MKLSTQKIALWTAAIVVSLGIIFICVIDYKLNQLYGDIQSTVVTDRNGTVVLIMPNARGNYSLFATSTPKNFADLLINKEDKYFYQHPGINPVGTTQLIFSKLGIGKRYSASTLDQQLTKILLEHETHRTVVNKFVETVYAVIFDFAESKPDILRDYTNTAYFGNHIQGLKTASQAYFGTPSEKLSTEQILQLLSTLSNPSYNNPLLAGNIEKAKILAGQLGVEVTDQGFVKSDIVAQNLNTFEATENNFELQSYVSAVNSPSKEIKLTVDGNLTSQIQNIVRSIAPSLSDRDAHNMAVVVMKVPDNQILSLIGSPDPTSPVFGQQINMLTEPRQVASTIKPFVYAKAFEMGARPYSLIDDQQYTYTTYAGQTYYLRNYDNKFHGRITAAYALDNSINIPAVKTLNFVGIDNFASFLSSLGYTDTKKVHDFEIGVALGTIDMTLPQLTHFYTIFPNQGQLLPVHLFSDPALNARLFSPESTQVIAPQYTQLVTKILSDRYLAIDQFGYQSDLNVPLNNYALKTGTSDDYRDSWVIGFTPDFIVGVWVGNANDTATKQLSGQSGAGEIWSQVMQLMAHTAYNRNTHFTFNLIRSTNENDNSAYGLPGDNIEQARDLFINSK